MKAAESAMKISLPTIKDGKILKFLFLPDEHDPSSLLEEEGEMNLKKELRKQWYFLTIYSD